MIPTPPRDLAAEARTWADGLEAGIEPDQHLAVMPVRNLRHLIKELRGYADELDRLRAEHERLKAAVDRHVTDSIIQTSPRDWRAKGLPRRYSNFLAAEAAYRAATGLTTEASS